MFSKKPKIRKYKIIDSLSSLKTLAREMSYLDEFAFDTETNTLRVLSNNKDFSLVGISISWGEYNNYYIPVGHLRQEDYARQLEIDVVVKYLKSIFERENIRIVGQNLKFDMHVLKRIGIEIKTEDLFDTMIASWLCDENLPNGLKENSNYYLGIDQTHFAEAVSTVPNDVKKEFGLAANSKATFDLVLIDDAAPYALDDAFYTFELYMGFSILLEDEEMDKIYNKVYKPFIRCLFGMEEQGVSVDLTRLNQMSLDIAKDVEELKYKMFDIVGIEFNPSSSDQLSQLLFGYTKEAKPLVLSKLPKIVQKAFEEGDADELFKRGFQIVETSKETYLIKISGNLELLSKSFGFRVISKTAKGAPQTNSDTLWTLSHMSFKSKRKQEGIEFCSLLLEYKKLEKLRSAFVEGLLEQLYDDKKAHPSFNIIGTDSGRLSCSSPNLQQLPKAEEEDKYQIRSLFIGSKDEKTGKRKKIIALDFANLEMRILAHFSTDNNLLEMFANDHDTHSSTAVNMFELDCEPADVKKKYPHLRQAAKILNFMLMYGGGAMRLYEALKEDRFNPIDLGDKSYLDMYKVTTGEEVAQLYIDKYFSTYSGVSQFIKNQKRYAHKHGYVHTVLKRKRRLPNINGRDMKTVSYEERLSVNATIQGSAADLTMSAQNRIAKDPWFKQHGCYMLIQVHDELVFECPEEYVEEAISRIKHYMEHAFGDDVSLNLPMKADADSGDSYQEAK